jgi:proteasome inhibitor subunit 1 (PI31)
MKRETRDFLGSTTTRNQVEPEPPTVGDCVTRNLTHNRGHARVERPRGCSRHGLPDPFVSSSPMATPAATLAVLRASRPRCRHASDVLAFALHAAFSSAGFRLVAAGPKVDDSGSADATAPPDDSEDPLDDWNAWDDVHAFSYVPETSGGGRRVRDETSSALMLKSVVLKTLTVGDACVASVSATWNRGDTKIACAQIDLSKHIDAELARTDPVGAVRDVDELVAEVNEKLLPCEKGGSAKSRDREERERNGSGKSSLSGVGEGRYLNSGDGTYTPDGMYPGNDPSTSRGIYPPRGARFDPYGPPDIPEFAPGRFGRDSDPLRGFPENPDATFGGVPDGFGGFPGRGRGGPPPGWPPARGTGRGPPDIGPPPQG